MQFLKKAPLYLFLLVLFFCLHGWLDNYGFIKAAEVIYPGLLILLAVITLTAIVFLFTRDILFASLVVFFISLWYLFFGALHDWIKDTAFLSFLKSYTVLLPALLIVTICWIIFLKRKRNLHSKLALFLNILLLIYCGVDIFSLTRLQVQQAPKQAAVINFDQSKVMQKPAVYLLLFDGYPGFKNLKDSFGFVNDSLQHYLASRSFSTPPVSTNYDLTYFSMSSIFNMKYVKDDFDNMNLTQRDFQKRGVEINQGAIFPIFRSMGYGIKNLSIFEIDNEDPVSSKNSFVLAHSILLTDKILHNRMKRDIGDRLAKIIPFWPTDDFYQHDIDNKLTEKLLLEDIAIKKDKPQFTYAHFMMPHGPYYHDSLGNKNPFQQISHYTMWQNKPLFVAYVKYVNSRIYKMVDSIIAHDPYAIIIVMGDHGFRAPRGKSIYQPSRYDNLFAIHMPKEMIMGPKPFNTTVNLFPYIFNSQFGQSMAYLKDSAVILRF